MEIDLNSLMDYVERFFLLFYQIHQEEYKKIIQAQERRYKVVESARMRFRPIVTLDDLPGAGPDCLRLAQDLVRESIASGVRKHRIQRELSDRLNAIRFIVTIEVVDANKAAIKINAFDNPQNKRVRTVVKKVIKKLKKEGFDVE